MTESEPENTDTTETAPKNEESFFSFLKTVAFIIIGVIIIRVTIIEAYRIPSGSMLPTLKIGDHILVTKLNYNLPIPFVQKPILEYATPDRGDIVVFTRPNDPASIEDDSKINVIKRVLAIAGDEIEVRGTAVYLNGNALNEIDYEVWWENGGIRNFGPIRVPDGHVFLMGDNRDHSKDSRFWTEAFLPTWRIKGKALVVYWSWDSFRRIGTLIR